MPSDADQAQQNVREALQQFEDAANSTQPPTPVIAQVLQPLVESTASDGAVVWMPADAQTGAMVAAGRFGPAAALVIGEDNRPAAAVATTLQQVWAQGKPAVVGPNQNIFNDPAIDSTTQFLLPIEHEQQSIGLLELISPGTLDPKVYREYAAFAQQAATALGAYLNRRRAQVTAEDTVSTRSMLRLTQHLLTLERPQDIVEDLATQSRSMINAMQAAVVAFGRGRPMVAFADVVKADRKAVIIRNVEQLAETIRERRAPMSFVRDQSVEDDDLTLAPLVNELFTNSAAQGVTITPIRHDDTVVGVLMLEYADAEHVGQRASVQQEMSDSVAGVLARSIASEERPLRRVSNALAAVRDKPRSALVRAAVVVAVAVFIVWLLLFMPVPLTIKADARLEPAQMALLTMTQDGRIDECLVDTGQYVEADQPVLRLDDQDWQLQHDDVTRQIRSAEVALDDLLGEADPAKWAQQMHELVQLDIRLKTIERSLERCIIRAPIAGRVLTRDPQRLVGRTMRVGTDLMEVAQLDEFRLIMDIPEADLALIEQRLHAQEPVTVEFLSRAWPDVLHNASIDTRQAMSATNFLDPKTNRYVFQVIIPIKLEGMREELALASASGRAALVVGRSSVTYRYGREAWRFLRMTLMF